MLIDISLNAVVLFFLVVPPPAADGQSTALQESHESELHPYTDYCSMLGQEIQGRKHAFLAGNLVYYGGGGGKLDWSGFAYLRNSYFPEIGDSV